MHQVVTFSFHSYSIVKEGVRLNQILPRNWYPKVCFPEFCNHKLFKSISNDIYHTYPQIMRFFLYLICRYNDYIHQISTMSAYWLLYWSSNSIKTLQQSNADTAELNFFLAFLSRLQEFYLKLRSIMTNKFHYLSAIVSWTEVIVPVLKISTISSIHFPEIFIAVFICLLGVQNYSKLRVRVRG